jgi:hypothetical protein
MKRKTDIALAAVAIILVCLFMAFTSGCIEEQQTPKVWGNGELPEDFVSFFGTGNNARLNKAQNDLLNMHNVTIHGMDQMKDGKTTHIPGITDYLAQFDARLKMLEAVDPNASIPRIEALEHKRAVQDGIDRAIIKGVEGSANINRDIEDEHGCIIGQTLAAPLCGNSLKTK